MSVLNDAQFSYTTLDTGGKSPVHVVQAHLGESELGIMTWGSKGVRYIGVEPEHRRQGIATKLWEHGHSVAAENRRVPAPKHSADRTNDGDAWAKSVGGPLPRRVQ